MCFPSVPKPQQVIVDSQSRQVNAAADALAQQRRTAQGYSSTLLNTQNGLPTLGSQILLGH